MPPRLRFQTKTIRLCAVQQTFPPQCRYASAPAVAAPAPPINQIVHSIPRAARFPPTQPPSHKKPELRKTQLHRQYTSLLRSSPVILLFQHNNLRAIEWMGIRRELAVALRKLDAEEGTSYADSIKIQIIQTGIFASALRVVEFYKPEEQPELSTPPIDPLASSSAKVSNNLPQDDTGFSHFLSPRAHKAASNRKLRHDLEMILSGPVAMVSFPAVSPQHLKTVLSLLAPNKDFPAPRRAVNPGYHEPDVQAGIQKLMLLAARVEGATFDTEGTRWVGGIQGGIDGLRGQLVAVMQSMGASITNALGSASISLYFTMENRKAMLEEEQKGGETLTESSQTG